jgi:putative endopeptidase
MVKNILAAFGERVDTLEWMTAETKAKAKAKAQTMRIRRRLSGNLARLRRAGHPRRRSGRQPPSREAQEYKHQVAKLGQPVDQGEWWMTPQTVNAVQLPLQNAMNFPAAILERRTSIRTPMPPPTTVRSAR